MAIATLNIYRLTTHIDELRLVMEEKNIHILAINETKLDEVMPSSLVSVDGYSLERKDRNFFGGGVAIYIKNTIIMKLSRISLKPHWKSCVSRYSQNRQNRLL